jgi:hypothetical protein
MSTETDSLHLIANLQVNPKQTEIQDMTDNMRGRMTDRMADKWTDRWTKETMADTKIAPKDTIEVLEMSPLVSPSISTVIRDDHVLLHSDRSMK